MIAPHAPGRPTAATIDLDALAFNLRSAKAHIGARVAYLAVVKADAYGHGAVQCAKRLEAEGIDWFGVALPEEGVVIRAAGITRPILCLGSLWPGQEPLLAEYDLTPVVYTLRAAHDLNAYGAGIGRTFDIHVKVDTGMGRVGIDCAESESFAARIKAFDNLRVDGLMTHFAAAEDPGEDDFTRSQIEHFDVACDAFRRAGHQPRWLDLANSPGALAHPESRGNMVRLGGALYGLLDDIMLQGASMPDLRPVLSLRSRVAFVRELEKGESLGYGRTFVAQKDLRIALVPIGYGDGYPRQLSNKGNAMIEGCPAPLVGRISMDWVLFDITAIEAAGCDSEVLLIGEGISAGDLGRMSGTIGYDITCGLTARIPRIYAP